MKQHKAILTYIMLLISVSSFAQRAIYDDLFVSDLDFENALPVVSEDRLRLRDIPNEIYGEIKGHLNQGEIVHIQAITTDQYEIQGESHPWYLVSVFGEQDIHRSGWVYGKYISFQHLFPIEFWMENNPILRQYPLNIFNITKYRRQIAESLFGTQQYYAPAEWIKSQEFIDEWPMTIWHLKDYTVRKFAMDSGEIIILHQEGLSDFDIGLIDIYEDVSNNLAIAIGDSRADVITFLGEEYTEENDVMNYAVDPLIDVRQIFITLKDDIVTKIRIWTDYGAF